VALTATGFALGRRGDGNAGADTAGPTSQDTIEPTASSEACQPLTYQPCGSPAAPFTDGERCVEAHDDYDGVVDNGCEAAPDALDGSILDETLAANLVPASDVDVFDFDVADHYHFSCDGTVTVTLVAPAGVTMRLEVLDGDEVIGSAVSADGQPGVVKLREPNCGDDDSTTLAAQVSSVGSDRSPDDYTLTRTGSY
jgi:hypothetical protein